MDDETVKEVAKTAGKAIDASSDLGRFISRIMGDLLEDSVGLISDRLKFYRSERAILLFEKTRKKLNDREISDFKLVPPKIALPLIEKATLESEENLHDMWASLLAAAMDSGKEDITPRSINVLASLSVIEAKALNQLYAYVVTENIHEEFYPHAPLGFLNNGTAADDCLRHFLNLGILRPGVDFAVPASPVDSEHVVGVPQDTRLVEFTEFGKRFCNDVGVDVATADDSYWM